MICSVHDIPIYYKEYGEGKPVIFIHGWPVDHRMMADLFEPIFTKIQSYRRIYLDLPGMGKTPSVNWIKNSDDMLKPRVVELLMVLTQHTLIFHANEKLKCYTAILDAFIAYFERQTCYMQVNQK